MRLTERQLSSRQWFAWSVGLAGLVQLALFAYASGPGLAGTADSTYYLHAARSLREVGRLLHPDGSAYRYWPPLYPVLVAVVGNLMGLRLLHGACLLGSLLGWSWLGRKLLPEARTWVLPWALALGTPGLVVSKFVWGEAVFTLLFAAYAAALYQWLHTTRNSWLAVATLAAGLLPLQRTIGFFLLVGVGAGLLLAAVKHPRLRPGVVVHLGLSALGGLLWHYYALLLAAPSVYQINRGWAQFFSSMADYGFVLLRWLLPVRASWYGAGAPVGWGIGLILVLATSWPRQHPPMAVTRPAAGLLPRLLWASLFSFLLLILIATTFTRSAAGLYDAERYASVIFGPLVLLVMSSLPVPRTKAARWLLISVLGIWLVYSAGRACTNAQNLRQLPTISATQ
ncbi:hypothetical protein Q5H93_18650 [Hymenobacter sp. ASUV-10]|uniref:Glycosyltransferase RgtA/B/C/D-like domain-containing protein n=1 Tax=Hymenobacter aranciens TaxID=3063996 RepID=A0ABT9BEU7_9BACT|nr:hypothetical protein [Hymenobacter sp. ASUV-10]MDO7876772.1 hypothetical protein [Hymenobacter sp. ASUV-10]